MQSFDNFRIDAGNRFAHAAALVVAEAPSKGYNPVLVYGMPGTGKTHLLRSIERYALGLWPDLKVLYISAQTILDSTSALEPADIMLIDDAHLLAPKQQYLAIRVSQLVEQNKQVVLAARCTKPLPDILRVVKASAGGLIVDIHHPP